MPTHPPSPQGLLLRIALIALGAILAACLIAPWIYLAATSEPLRTILPALAEFPFRRFFTRTAQVAFFAGILPLLFQWRQFSPRSLGLERNPRAGRDALTGLVAALLPALLLAVLYIARDVYRPRKDLDWQPVVRILLTAGFVSCLEEFLFRGIFLGLAVQAWGRLRGAVGVTLLFAAVHFLHPPKVDIPSVRWTSGFELAAGVRDALPEGQILLSGFLTLLVAGGILAVVTLRTKSLWAAMGLHAGWILGQQGLHWFAKFQARPPDAFLPWVGPSLVSGAVPTGLVALAPLAVTALWAFFAFAARKGPPD